MPPVIVEFTVMFVWAVLLGIVNVQNKLYVLMFMWVWLTYLISSMAAVKTVFFIMTYALFATIVMHMSELMYRRARELLATQARPRPGAVAAAA